MDGVWLAVEQLALVEEAARGRRGEGGKSETSDGRERRDKGCRSRGTNPPSMAGPSARKMELPKCCSMAAPRTCADEWANTFGNVKW